MKGQEVTVVEISKEFKTAYICQFLGDFGAFRLVFTLDNNELG